MFKTYFALSFHQSKAGLCVSSAWLCWHPSTRWHKTFVPAQDWAASGAPNSDVTLPQLAKGRQHQYHKLRSPLEFRAGRYLHTAVGKRRYHPPRGEHTLLPIASSRFGTWQPGRFLQLRTWRDLAPTPRRDLAVLWANHAVLIQQAPEVKILL